MIESHGSTGNSQETIAPAEDELAILDLPRAQIARLFAFRHWVLTAARTISDTHAIVKGVGEGLVEVGVPLARMTTAVEVRHSERSGVGRVWEPGVPPREIFFPHGPESEQAFYASPLEPLMPAANGFGSTRRRRPMTCSGSCRN